MEESDANLHTLRHACNTRCFLPFFRTVSTWKANRNTTSRISYLNRFLLDQAPNRHLWNGSFQHRSWAPAYPIHDVKLNIDIKFIVTNKLFSLAHFKIKINPFASSVSDLRKCSCSCMRIYRGNNVLVWNDPSKQIELQISITLLSSGE